MHGHGLIYPETKCNLDERDMSMHAQKVLCVYLIYLCVLTQIHTHVHTNDRQENLLILLSFRNIVYSQLFRKPLTSNFFKRTEMKFVNKEIILLRSLTMKYNFDIYFIFVQNFEI